MTKITDRSISFGALHYAKFMPIFNSNYKYADKELSRQVKHVRNIQFVPDDSFHTAIKNGVEKSPYFAEIAKKGELFVQNLKADYSSCSNKGKKFSFVSLWYQNPEKAVSKFTIMEYESRKYSAERNLADKLLSIKTKSEFEEATVELGSSINKSPFQSFHDKLSKGLKMFKG